MTHSTYYYVCDACGLLHSQAPVPEGGEWACGDCGSSRAWEFDAAHAAAAREHAAHISRGIGKGGIFRTARRLVHE